MISTRIRTVRFQLEQWRLVGLASSIVGLSCYALSPSFKRLIGGWNSLKFFLYGVLVFLICTTILFAKQCSLSRHGKLKAHVGFAVLMLTSLYSFLYEKAMGGKPDALSMVSNAAFALMSLSLSRVVKLGFEVGLFSFFLGCLAVQLMTINLVLILVAIIFGYPLFVMHSSADSQIEVGSGDHQHELHTIVVRNDPLPNQLRSGSRKNVTLRGPKPPPLKISKESSRLRKPPILSPIYDVAETKLNKQKREPVIFYSVSPKVINVPVQDFMNVVQRLTGMSSSNSNEDESATTASSATPRGL